MHAEEQRSNARRWGNTEHYQGKVEEPQSGEHKEQKRKPKTRLGMQAGALYKMIGVETW